MRQSLLVLFHASPAEQDGVGPAGQLERFRRQGIPNCLQPGFADHTFLQIEGKFIPHDRAQHLDGLGRHFLANSVPWKYRDFHS